MKDYAYRKSVSEAQERSVRLRRIAEQNRAMQKSKSVTYRIYTEDRHNLAYLTGRYFDGSTLLYGNGAYKGTSEDSVIIEVIGTSADLQKIVDLAGDIRVVNAQESVLVTWSEVSTLDITSEVV